MKILIAPDKFKGVLTAKEAAANIAAGICDVIPAAEPEIQPVADGGEGTAEIICQALGGVWRAAAAHDARGTACDARFAWIQKTRTAVFEMSEVAGSKALTPGSFDLDEGTTFGVGEVLRQAAELGAAEIVVGLGGSMTNDGGFGMARALGYEFLGADDCLISKRVSDLTNLKRIRSPKHHLDGIRIVAAADVMNPLLGPEGATRVFGAQKGARPDQIEMLEQAIRNLADVVERDLGGSFRDRAGAGAAGGLGFGLLSFCGAEIRPGFDVVAQAINLESKIAAADIVITGEGSLDRQTLAGKAPARVAAMAAKLGKKAFAVVGRSDGDAEVRSMFEGIFEVGREKGPDAEQVRRAPDLLRAGGQALAREVVAREKAGWR